MSITRLEDVWFARPNELPYAELEKAERLMAAAAHKSGADRHERGLPLLRKGQRHVCAHCGDGSDLYGVEFYDYDSGLYPKSKWRLAVRWICTTQDERHPFVGYVVMLGDRADPTRPFVESWHSHLATKCWYDLSFRRELEIAEAFFEERARAYRRRRNQPTSDDLRREARAISTRLRTKILERDGFRCRRCGAGPDEERLVIDHIQPVARGGSAHPENLQTLCRPCNAGKAAKAPHAHDLDAPEAP